MIRLFMLLMMVLMICHYFQSVIATRHVLADLARHTPTPPTSKPTTAAPTTKAPTTQTPTTQTPTTPRPTTSTPTTTAPTTMDPTTSTPTTPTPTSTQGPTTTSPTTFVPTSSPTFPLGSNGPTSLPSSMCTLANGTVGACPCPDVFLDVPKLHVGEVGLLVKDLTAHVELDANVAQLILLAAGVSVSLEKVNLSITNVDATLTLNVKLDQVATIVAQTLQTLDVHPEIQRIGTTLDHVVDNIDRLVSDLGVILSDTINSSGQRVVTAIDKTGEITTNLVDSSGVVVESTSVGSYVTEMTATGIVLDGGNGTLITQYVYPPNGVLVNITTKNGQVIGISLASNTTTNAPTTIAPTSGPQTTTPPTSQTTTTASPTTASTTAPTSASTTTAAPTTIVPTTTAP